MGAKGRQSSMSKSKWRRLRVQKSREAEKKALEEERASFEAYAFATQEVSGGQIAHCPAKPFTVKDDKITSPPTSTEKGHSLVNKTSMVNEVESVRAVFERYGIVFGCPDRPASVSPSNVPYQLAMDKEHQISPLAPHPPFPGGGGGCYGYLPNIPQASHVDIHAPWFPASSYPSFSRPGPSFSQGIPPVEPFPPPNSYTTGDHHIFTPLDCCQLYSPSSPDSLISQNQQEMEKNHASVFNPILKQDEMAASHLLNASESGKHSDVNIILYSCTGIFSPISHSVHRIIASRSRRLSSLLDQLDNKESPNLYILAGASFTYPSAFVSALLCLYGQPLFNQDQLLSQILLHASDKSNIQAEGDVIAKAVRISRMNFALCYAMAGAFFMDSRVVERGLEMVSDVLCWETLEPALSFGLCPIPFELAVIDLNVEGNSNSNGSTDKVDNNLPTTSYVTSQTLVALAKRVLNISLRFVVDNIPVSFKLDKPSCSFIRLPHSSIMPPNISLLLLSLPFKQLRKLFKYMRLQGKLTEELVKEVVQEREAHRMLKLRNLPPNRNLRGHLDSEHEILGWEEQALFDAEQPLGAIIGRDWIGLEIRPVLLASSRLRRSKTF
ncbi:hypothetical protein MauCBS54593_001285 [Microsporum audouinii]